MPLTIDSEALAFWAAECLPTPVETVVPWSGPVVIEDDDGEPDQREPLAEVIADLRHGWLTEEQRDALALIQWRWACCWPDDYRPISFDGHCVWLGGVTVRQWQRWAFDFGQVSDLAVTEWVIGAPPGGGLVVTVA